MIKVLFLFVFCLSTMASERALYGHDRSWHADVPSQTKDISDEEHQQLTGLTMKVMGIENGLSFDIDQIRENSLLDRRFENGSFVQFDIEVLSSTEAPEYEALEREIIEAILPMKLKDFERGMKRKSPRNSDRLKDAILRSGNVNFMMNRFNSWSIEDDYEPRLILNLAKLGFEENTLLEDFKEYRSEANSVSSFLLNLENLAGIEDRNATALLTAYLVAEEGMSLPDAQEYIENNVMTREEQAVVNGFNTNDYSKNDLLEVLQTNKEWNYAGTILSPADFEELRLRAIENCSFSPPSLDDRDIFAKLESLSSKAVTMQGSDNPEKCVELRNRFAGSAGELQRTLNLVGSLDDKESLMDQTNLASAVEQFVSTGCQFTDKNVDFSSRVLGLVGSFNALSSLGIGEESASLVVELVGAGTRLISSLMEAFKGPTPQEILDDNLANDKFNNDYLDTMCNVRKLVYTLDNQLTNSEGSLKRAIETESDKSQLLAQKINICRSYLPAPSQVIDRLAGFQELNLEQSLGCGEKIAPFVTGELATEDHIFYQTLNDTCGENQKPYCYEYQQLVSLIQYEKARLSVNGVEPPVFRICMDPTAGPAIKMAFDRLRNLVQADLLEYSDAKQPDPKLLEAISNLEQQKSQVDNTINRLTLLAADTEEYDTLFATRIEQLSGLFLEDGPIESYFNNLEHLIKNERNAVEANRPNLTNKDRNQCEAAKSIATRIENITARKTRALNFCKDFNVATMVNLRKETNTAAHRAISRFSMTDISGVEGSSYYYQRCERFKKENPRVSVSDRKIYNTARMTLSRCAKD